MTNISLFINGINAIRKVAVEKLDFGAKIKFPSRLNRTVNVSGATIVQISRVARLLLNIFSLKQKQNQFIKSSNHPHPLMFS